MKVNKKYMKKNQISINVYSLTDKLELYPLEYLMKNLNFALIYS